MYGMNKNIGNISFNDPQGEYGYGKPYSDKTAELIDQEVRNLISDMYEQTKQLLTDHREGLEKIAQALLQKEIIFQTDLEELLGKRPFDARTTYDEFVNGEEEKVENAETVVEENNSESPIESAPLEIVNVEQVELKRTEDSTEEKA
jgi:cell division protease FtsH